MKKGSIKGNVGGLAPENRKHWTEEYPIIVEGLKQSLMNTDSMNYSGGKGNKLVFNDGFIEVELNMDLVKGYCSGLPINFIFVRNLDKSTLKILENKNAELCR